mgnify:CR=1 FL=1
MKSLSFRKDLVGVQEELLRFAYKLTTDREEANDSRLCHCKRFAAGNLIKSIR